MPLNREEAEFADFVVDCMQTIGPVTGKPMFGGFGIFLDGMMLGLIADRELFLKVDKENKAEFEEAGLEAFAYDKNGKVMKMSYHHAPEDIFEDSEQMLHWGNSAFAAALRTAAKKTAKKNAGTKKAPKEK